MAQSRPLGRDEVVRKLTNWMEARITGKRTPREDVINFLIHLSPEERDGIWKLRTFYSRYKRGKRAKKPTSSNVRVNGPRMDPWAKPA